MKKAVRIMRTPLETGVFTAGMALVPWLPRAAVLRLATILGAMAYRLDLRSRRIAMANLTMVYPDLCRNGAGIPILREAFRVFSLTSMDLFWFARRTPERLREYVLFDESFKTYFRHTSLIAVCAHFGNWEILGQAVALAGAPSVSVAASISNRMIDRRVRRLRSRTGQVIIPQEGAARGLLRALRDNRPVALLLDQNTRPREGGVWTPFFGLPVPVSGIVELLAARTGAPVLTVYGYPRADGRYLAMAGPLRHAVPVTDGHPTLTAALMGDLEERVSRDPGNWLWMYKRWKYIPPDADPRRYPFYAHHSY